MARILFFLVHLLAFSEQASADSVFFVVDDVVSVRGVDEQEVRDLRQDMIGLNIDLSFFSNGNVARLVLLEKRKQVEDTVLICDLMKSTLSSKQFDCAYNDQPAEAAVTMQLETYGPFIKSGSLSFLIRNSDDSEREIKVGFSRRNFMGD